MSAVRSIHLKREEWQAAQDRNAQAAEAQGYTAIADAIRAQNTDKGHQAADNQWGWTK